MSNVLLIGQLAAAVGVIALGRGQEPPRERAAIALGVCIATIGILAR